MGEPRRGRKVKTLLGLILLAFAYIGWLYYRGTLTGTDRLDGIIGVLLGLYICSHPAANMLDMLFFERGNRPQGASAWSTVLWLALNLLTLLSGWNALFAGITRFVRPAP